MRALMLIAALSVGGCNHSDSELKKRVEGYCLQLRSDVARDVKQYEGYADQLRAGGVSDARQQELQDVLAVDSIGTAEPVRRAKLRDINDRFQFCARMHPFDEHRLDDLQVRAEKLGEQLLGPAVVASPDQTVQLLKQLAALVYVLDGVAYLE